MRKPLMLLMAIVFTLALTLPPLSSAGDSECTLNMDIRNPRFGITADAEGPVSMEDAGCALLKRADFCASEIISFESSAMGQDYLTGESISFVDAFFVMDAGIDTPLGTGIVIFKEKSSAEGFIKDGGKVLTYKDMIEVNIRIK